MKTKTPTAPPLALTEGFYVDETFSSFEMLGRSNNNWKHLCPYQLQPNGLNVRHQILHLTSMQIVSARREGGSMTNIIAAKESLSIAVIEACEDKGCFDKIKLHTGDIFFFDDSHPHNFVSNNAISFSVVTIQKHRLESLHFNFSKIIDHIIRDTDKFFTNTLHKLLTIDIKSYQDAEEEILATIMKLLSEQTPGIPKLTVGEKTTLEIRDQFLHHMDGEISISALAKQHHVSGQTLQNSFKALFGFTPQRFLRTLKLNLVYYDLQKSDPKCIKVSEIASKWGFIHMGRFSAYYTELFGEYPSQTLNTPYDTKEDFEETCVARQEEITE